MKKLIYIAILSTVISSCTKEVLVDIPESEEKLVVDGRIETGEPPVILLTRSNNIYDETSGNLLLESLVSGATVTVSDGSNSVVLDEICSQSLPPGTEEAIASFLNIDPEELDDVDICFYSTTNTAIYGQVGKTYTLDIDFEGEQYNSTTQILQPHILDSLYWKEDPDNPDNGYSWMTLTDPAGQFDAYFWECRRINLNSDGEPIDDRYRTTFNPAFDDAFFDGLTFDFAYENPFNFNQETPPEERGFYQRGDTVVVKFSKINKPVYEFMEMKYTQLQTGGSPFATPSNLPSNISNGALGVWAGYSPSYDTLVCDD
ncbi:MAG: hypothetical protein COA32_10045 [Fluviicola sp.]|nr:MAG: hypothetical protein COA32_10045 [Fluviicola sp.]